MATEVNDFSFLSHALLALLRSLRAPAGHCFRDSRSTCETSAESIDRFHCHATKKKIGNRPVEEAKKMKRYRRLIFKQFVQVSGLCGPQFQSYLPKRFTHLCRALYGDAILVHSFGAPIWPPKINKNIWSTLFL